MRSLRWRSGVTFATVAAAASMLIGASVFQITASGRLDEVRDGAADRVRVAASTYADTQTLVFGAVAHDSAAPQALRAAVREGRVATFLDSSSRAPTIWAGAPVGDASLGVYVRQSYRDQPDVAYDLARTLALAGFMVTAASAALGSFLAARHARRLREAGASASRVAAGYSSAATPLRGHDEVADLSQLVDNTVRSLRAQLEREQRYAADIAHELRTPVTGLAAAVELVGEDADSLMVRERVMHLSALVESLLEVARLDGDQEVADGRRIDLGALVREIAYGRGAVVEEADGDLQVWTDPRRLVRVIANLLDNARLHGAPPVVVSVSSHRVQVRDHGPGFPPDLISRATERFVSGAGDDRRRTGLGLAIASGQAGVIDAGLRVANHPEGGALVTVELPRDDRPSDERARRS